MPDKFESFGKTAHRVSLHQSHSPRRKNSGVHTQSRPRAESVSETLLREPTAAEMIDDIVGEIVPNRQFSRGAHWTAIVVKVSSFSDVSVIPESSWPAMDAMERSILRKGLRKTQPQGNRSYVALIGGRPMRVNFFCKRGPGYDVFLIDTGESRYVRDLFELPEESSPDHIPSFSKSVSLCSEHMPDRMNFLKFRTLLEHTCPYVGIVVTKTGNPANSENTPEVLFLDEFCMDVVDSHGLSGAPLLENPKKNLRME